MLAPGASLADSRSSTLIVSPSQPTSPTSARACIRERKFDGSKAYNQSKLALRMVTWMFAVELEKDASR